MNKITNNVSRGLHKAPIRKLKNCLHLSKRLLMAVSFTIACLQQAWAYDFSATSPSGQTLYFYISSNNTVNVVWPNSNATDIANIYDGYTEPTGNLVIPSSVTHNGTTYTVAGIGTAFANCEGLTSVTIPNTVIGIYKNAFRNCTGLTSVTIPNSVTTIGYYAFYGCSALTSATIGNSVTTIGRAAFYECSGLTSITIPNSVTSIGVWAFGYCGNLESVTLPNSLAIIDTFTFYNCSSLDSITIPNSVTSIGNYAFYHCISLDSITIPNSVTTIGDYAFYYCTGLTSATIGNSVTTIGESAFSSCSGFTSLTIPNSVTFIETDAFGLVRNIIYSGTATGSPWGALNVNGYIDGDFIYSDSTKTKLTAYIGSSSNVTIPNTVTAIGYGAFYSCDSLISVNIPNSVTSIGESAFSSCSSLTSVMIPNSITTIGEGVFTYCSSLTSVTIPNSVTSIGDFAFSSCSGLTSITIPNSVTSIGDFAFTGCSGLTSITIPNSVTSIGDYAFYGCSGLTSATIGNSVTSIGAWAFEYCSGLTSITIPNSVTSIGNGSFYGCSGLTSITIPNSVTSIGKAAFYECSGLTSITIPNSVTSIGVWAFGYCGNLVSVDMSNSVAIIDTFTFYGCSSLISVTIPNSITSIRDYAFYSCTGLASVTIPNSVTSIGDSAFYDCRRLSTLYCYPLQPPVLKNNVFSEVSSNFIVYVPASVIGLYQETVVWRDFILLPIVDNVSNLTINMPNNIDIADYEQMRLEITNIESGQKRNYVITGNISYTFYDLIDSTTWTAVVKNQRGDIFGRIDTIELGKNNKTVQFASLLKPQTVQLKVFEPDSTDVSSNIQITWVDNSNNYLQQGQSIAKLPSGKQLKCIVVLPQSLLMNYKEFDVMQYVVNDSNNVISIVLDSIEDLYIQGKVKNEGNNIVLANATISISQIFGGKYTKTTLINSNSQGLYSTRIYNVPTTITVSMADYVSQTLVIDSLISGVNDTLNLQDILLKAISGVVVDVDFTYTNSVEIGEQPDIINWYSDYNNVEYTIYNRTKNRNITQFNVQYPQIVLMEETDEGDVLRLRAISKNNSFTQVEKEVTVDTTLRASVTFDIVELGKILAEYDSARNNSVIGSLYNSSGNLVNTYNYSGRSLTISNLADGTYTLVSMGSSRFLNTIYKLSEYAQAGLVENTHYVKNVVTVESGVVSTVSISEIPELDEAAFYYTGDGTSFTVNKPSVVIGNYLTFTGRINFKPTYDSAVNNVQIIVDLPNECMFVDNSVMVGSGLGSYTTANNRVVIPLTHYTDRVRFCVIPTEGGSFTPSAFVRFIFNGDTITQPIGSAKYKAKNLAIKVPQTVTKTNIVIIGEAKGGSLVEIYDNNTLVGQTTALGNGTWKAECTLADAYNLSTHSIYAKTTTSQGMVLLSETKECVYNINDILVSKVTMYYNNQTNVFDFENPSATPQNYTYSSNTAFTFTIEFNNNDTSKIHDVILNVKTLDNKWIPIETTYDINKGFWVASATTEGLDYSYPVNVNVDFVSETIALADRNRIQDKINRISEENENLENVRDSLLVLDRENLVIDSLSIKKEGMLDSLTYRMLNDLEYDSIFAVYLTSMGIETDINEFIVNVPTFTDSLAFIAYMDSLLTVGDSLLANLSTDTLVFDLSFDSIYLEIISSMDSLFNMDSIFNQTPDTIQLEIEGSLYSIYSIPYNELDFTRIDSANITTIAMTDGTHILFYSDQLTYFVADSLNRSAWVIELDSVLNNVRFGAKLGDALSNAISTIQLAYKRFSNWFSIFKEELEKEYTNLLSSMEEMESKRLTVLSKSSARGVEIKELEKQIQALEESIKKHSQFGIVSNRLNEQKEQLMLQRKKLWQEIKNIDKELDKLNKQKNTIKSKSIACKLALDEIGGYVGLISDIWGVIDHIRFAINDMNRWASFIETIPINCENSEILINNANSNMNNIRAQYIGSVSGISVITALSGYLSFNKAFKAIPRRVKVLLDESLDWVRFGVENTIDNVRNKSARLFSQIEFEKRNLECEEENDDNEEENDDDETRNPDSTPNIDPSGYVYEGVHTNRLEGVTATCYYKDYVEDMYGDFVETVVLWDAENYAQENPLFTDENGMYRWDVPQGMWQVKFEKEGYETTYSEWLPVPPPQLEVNIGMTQTRQPQVLKARAYDDAVEIEFDKYMKPYLLNTNNIIVFQNDSVVSGSIELLNEEYAYKEGDSTFASKVRFNADTFFTANEITLLVTNQVKSYADIRMHENFIQTFPIEHEIKKIVCDSVTTVKYGRNRTLTISALPATASAGKTLIVDNLSKMILGVATDSILLDSNGVAQISVRGELPGTSALRYSIKDYDISATSIINVSRPIEVFLVSDTSACEEFMYNGVLYTENTVLRDTVETLLSDTISVFSIIINNSCDTTLYTTICHGDTYEFANYTVSAPGIYIDTLQNILGCDSIVRLVLTVNPLYDTTINENICLGETYTDNGFNVSVAGTHIDTLQTIYGCDSVVRLVLTVNPLYDTTINASICSGETYTANGFNVSVAGTYTDTLQTINGCDSIIRLVLSVNNPSTETDVVSACDSYTWIDGINYTTSNNTATYTLTNAVGCDSIVTLNLTINNSTTGTDSVTACNSYTWIDGITYTSSNNIATYTYTNVAECDSVVTLILTINHSVYDTIVDTAMNEYTWNGTTYTESGVYEYVGETTEGCDSIVTLMLTITTVGIDAASELDALTFYPNPTNGTITFNRNDIRKVEVMDGMGRMVAVFEDSYVIDLSNLSKGYYTMRITTNDGVAIRKVIRN